jgi:nitrite reductase/ring-hydroxylating ferredoxin subunit
VRDYIRVCELDDIPPGKGKVVRVGGVDVNVYNREGRIFAQIEDHRFGRGGHGGQSPPGEASCRLPGSHFDVEQSDSPARLGAHNMSVRVRVVEDAVWVALEMADAHTTLFGMY